MSLPVPPSAALEAPRKRRLRHMNAVLALVLLACALWPFAATDPTGAQAPQLEVTDVKAVQVIEDVPLVLGKATILRVFVTAGANGQARVQVSLGGRSRESGMNVVPGFNTVWAPVDPPTAPGQVEITASISTPSGEGGNRVSRTVQVVSLTRRGMNVIFLPVDWTNNDRAKYYPAMYNSFVAQTSDFFRAAFPFAEGNVRIGTSDAFYALTQQERAIVDGRGNFRWDNITAMYTSIALAGQRIMGDADLVVGVLPPRWFARNLNEPNTVGLELHAVRQVVANQVDSDYATLAHEAGHVYGRNDDYNFDINPPKIGNRLDSPGFWVLKNRPIDPAAKPVFYSFMGAQDANSQYWIDRTTYMTLLSRMQRGP
jgi:hypothetical protein